MWLSQPILIVLLLVSVALILSSLWGKSTGKAGAWCGSVLLSATIGLALVIGVSCTECATVVMLLLLAVLSGGRL